MTVKRRLFISNILMIVIPVLLFSIMGAIVIHAAVNIFGITNDKNFSYEFENAASQVQKLSEQWTVSGQPQKISGDVEAFGKQYSKYGIALRVFQNDALICGSGEFSDEALLQTILFINGNHNFLIDSTVIYKTDAGAYTVLLAGSDYTLPFGMWRDARSPHMVFYFGIIFFAVVIAIILLTNRLLTRMVYKSIAIPLDALVYGVHQIRDGNLEYRIEYMGKDEFSIVCADFNEMAGRLLDMVNARQKDDENRRELIAGISHDLRTPLTSIISYVEGLEKGIASTPAIQKKYFDTIKSKAMDLNHIVSQLFLFSKLDIGDFPFRLENLDAGNEIIRFTASVSNEYKEKGLQIITDTIEKGICISADSVQLRNVFTNIFENSVKYGNKENGIVRVSCKADKKYVHITLTDNGPGVTDDALPDLFSAFYRGDKARTNPGQGSGLGLAITAKILERLGGSIVAENVADGGLRVTITLPIVTGGIEDEKNIDY